MAHAIQTTHGAMTASELRDRIIAQAAADDGFRARLLADPRAALNDDYDVALPEGLKVHVHEDDATTAHLVLPRSKKLTEEELKATSGAWSYW